MIRLISAILIPLVATLPTTVADSLYRQLTPANTQLDFSHRLVGDHPYAYLYHSGFAVSGMCLGDINGDGVLDIYLSNGPEENRLFFGGENTVFHPQNTPNLTGGDKWGSGASLVDIDNDGDLDLYQCNYDAPNQLFLNDGKGNFSELAEAAGLAVQDASMAASFADVDNDGDLDMFLLCNRYYSATGRPKQPPFKVVNGVPVVTEEYKKHYHIKKNAKGAYNVDDYGRRDYFFLNEGLDTNGIPHFKNISESSGLSQKGFGLSCAWWDFDSDGDLDLYVANDFTAPDRLFCNQGLDKNGEPQFKDVSKDYLPSCSWSSMGSDVADVNNDGLPDLFSVDMSATSHFKAKSNMGALSPAHRLIMETGNPRQDMRNHLFLAGSPGMLRESARAMNIASTNWSWSAKFGDLDNDGWQDLFVSNGMARDFSNADHGTKLGDLLKARIGRTEWDLYKDTSPMLETNLALQNSGGSNFKNRPDWGLGLHGMSYCSVMGDLDNDGDLDLIVSDLGKHVKVFQNQGTEGNSFRVKLTGTKSNRMGIGAKVTITDSNGDKRSRWMNPWTGFQGQNDTTLHFGLGAGQPKKVTVVWPSGIYQELALKPDSKEISITEKRTGLAPKLKKQQARFSATTAPEFTHKDEIFDDFKRQPLLPIKLSQLGPCLAKGDVDGDGDEDIFVGGATEQLGTLLLNNKGTFTESPQEAFTGLAKYAEDSAALWFDADGDKDLDLYVVTGSTEYDPGDILYIDHLYLNESKDGKVILTEAPDDTFPNNLDSGSCVVAADYDSDGDLDLFIGSRSIPGQYPLVPENRLLRNDTKDGIVKFTDATPESLKSCGMVTAAQWGDLDKDGDPDLSLTLDWGAVTLFQNESGNFTNVTETAGTAEFRGWWRSLKAVDVDGDGDLDLISGNVGINTKYKSPSEKKPAMIYYGDMDGSGKNRIVEAKKGKDVHNRDRPLPVRGRS